MMYMKEKGYISVSRKNLQKDRPRGLNEVPILLHANIRQYFANRRIHKFQRKWVVTLLSPTMPPSPPRPGAPTLGKTFCYSIFGEQEYLCSHSFAVSSNQYCGSVIRDPVLIWPWIRCLFDPWIRCLFDPWIGTRMNIPIIYPRP